MINLLATRSRSIPNTHQLLPFSINTHQQRTNIPGAQTKGSSSASPSDMITGTPVLSTVFITSHLNKLSKLLRSRHPVIQVLLFSNTIALYSSKWDIWLRTSVTIFVDIRSNEKLLVSILIAAHAYGYGYGYGYGHGAGETLSHSHNVCMGSGRKTLVASGVLAFYRLMLDASHHSARFEVLRNVEDVQERSIPLEDLESLMYDKSSGLFLVCLCAIHT